MPILSQFARLIRKSRRASECLDFVVAESMAALHRVCIAVVAVALLLRLTVPQRGGHGVAAQVFVKPLAGRSPFGLSPGRSTRIWPSVQQVSHPFSRGPASGQSRSQSPPQRPACVPHCSREQGPTKWSSAWVLAVWSGQLVVLGLFGLAVAWVMRRSFLALVPETKDSKWSRWQMQARTAEDIPNQIPLQCHPQERVGAHQAALDPMRRRCPCAICQAVVAAAPPDALWVPGFGLPVGEGAAYAMQLEVKCVQEQKHWPTRAEVLASPALHHRLRVRLALGPGPDGALRFGVYEPHKSPRALTFATTALPVATRRINAAMEALLAALNREGVRGTLGTASLCMFLDTQCGSDLLVTLMYSVAGFTEHAEPAALRELARAVRSALPAAPGGRSAGRVKVLARAKRGRLRIGTSDALEEENVAVDRGLFPGYALRQSEGSFSNPNGFVAAGVNAWLRAVLAERVPREAWLLELCSGCGNHTVGLGTLFSRALCIEIDSQLCARARENVVLNGITHVQVVCEDMLNTRAVLQQYWGVEPGMLQQPQVQRHIQTQMQVLSEPQRHLPLQAESQPPSHSHATSLQPADSHQFTQPPSPPTIVALVDPPRGGLSPKAVDLLVDLEMVDVVVYVACGDGLEQDWPKLNRVFDMDRLLFADHFPFTHYLEKVAVLRRRR